MRRRLQAGFAWVSMMDLLFALFGGLIVLTVLISTKLGAVSPIDERRFHALTLEVAARDKASSEALSRMSIQFVVFPNEDEEKSCQFGASVPSSTCLDEFGDGHGHDRRLTEFATAAVPAQGTQHARLIATLLITEPRAEGALNRLAIMPVLGNEGQLREHGPLELETEFDLRLSVKSQREVWEIPVLSVSVHELLNKPERRSDFGARLLPPDLATRVRGAGAAECVGDCGNIKPEGEGKLVFSWR